MSRTDPPEFSASENPDPTTRTSHGYSREIIARFEAERQALALMDHPCIARVFDAGSTPQGRPYFVMKYVHGVSITSYCDKQRLTMRQRLDLFLQLCEGVQHAHQKAILHRDLKPSNVLVTVLDDKPVPKIIDFGLAKATACKLTEKTLHTALGELIGTPEYMTPEQAEMSGKGVDTRTDVNSLGVIQSVGSLAEDGQRYMTGQAILPRPPSTAYELRKLVQVSDPFVAQGNTVTARELLDKGAGRIERELGGEPLVQARMLDTMGNVYRSLGLYESGNQSSSGLVPSPRLTYDVDRWHGYGVFGVRP